jgi:hypothetical protein
MKDIAAHPLMRFECLRCGRCCRGWQVSFSRDVLQKLASRKWDEIFPRLRGRKLFERIRNPHGRAAFRFKLQENDACAFLADDNSCMIHGKFGPQAKAPVCRIFPFTFLHAPDGVRLGLRFNCPGVIRGTGETLSMRQAELKEAFKLYVDEVGEDVVSQGCFLTFDQRLSWTDAGVIEDAFISFLANEALSLSDRLHACFALAETLDEAKVEKIGPDRLPEFIRLVTEAVASGAPSGGCPALTWMDRTFFGRFLNLLHLREYRRKGGASVEKRLATRVEYFMDGVKFLFQRGAVRLGDMPAPARIEQAAKVRVELGEEAQDLLLRYLICKMTGRNAYGPLMFGAAMVEGVHLLMASVAAVLWFARLFAAGEGLRTAGLEHVRRAVMYVDHTVSGSGALSRTAEKARIFAIATAGTARRILGAELGRCDLLLR